MAKPVDITGQVFHRLTALHRVRIEGVTRSMWRFRCTCGNETTIFAKNAMRGVTKSCGCLAREKSGQHFVTHGRAKTPEHHAWLRAKARCHNPNNPDFADYGGRGIEVCAEWRNSFEAFLCDVGPRPSPNHSLGRIDNDGPYAPGNVRWETRFQQARNKRSNRYVMHNGEKLTLKQYAKLKGTDYRLAHSRLQRGWTAERAVGRAVNSSRHKWLEAGGVRRTVAEWAKRLGTQSVTIHQRLRHGWSVERAVTEPLHRR